ncbi:metallophosphoesterase family protein [Sphingobium boeckii]
MIANLFRFKKKAAAPSAATPDDQRIYAIGDIHGRLDLFDALLQQIDEDLKSRPRKKTSIILLGDLIDRGPESRGVVERAMALKCGSSSIRFLKGNHEEVFLRALKGDSQVMRFLIRIGGKSTVMSYGVSEEEYNALDYEDLTALLMARVPQSHVDFLESFDDMIEMGDYVFVHAGIRPDVELDAQTSSDMRWIRDEFLDCQDSFGKMIVHGHTITEDIEYRSNRIGIDTGAYASGKLTAIGLEGTDVWSLQTG